MSISPTYLPGFFIEKFDALLPANGAQCLANGAQIWQI
jgi:hypothetical protein